MAVNRLQTEIDRIGGISTVSDLGRRWGMSRQGAQQASKREGFPSPVLYVSGAPLYSTTEADVWRSKRGRQSKGQA